MHPTRHLFVLLGCAGALVSTGAAAAAGKPAPRPDAGNFSKVIPAPTGKNGYEELVAAGDVLRTSKLFLEAERKEPGAPLALKRRVLADRPVVRALALLKQGLSKPVLSPRAELTFSTTLPELSAMRSLARLLRMQQYVFLADGRTGEAIQSARTCMRLGRVVQMDTLIHGLVGVAIGAIGVRSLGSHLDQLSARDCEALYAVCLEWLRYPEPLAALYESERRSMRGSLAEAKAKGLEALFVADESDADPETEAAIAELKALQAGSPEALDAIFAQTLREIDGFYARVQQELLKPAWERRWSEIEPALQSKTGAPQELGARLAAMLVPTVQGVSDAFTREQAYVRLLACHCAIRRYRWEHERLPGSLEELALGPLAIDPFTGRLLQYSASGSDYRLASVGPAISPDDPRAVDGRLPLTIDR